MPILSNFPGGAGSGSGGLTLAAVSGITTQVSSGKVYVKWTDPDDLVVAGSTIAAWGGTLLVRKAGSAPTSRRDGTIVLDISVKPVGWESFASLCSTAWWWERSPNYNNSNNFCNVNTNGNANNNNARNSNGVAPDFVNQKWSGSIVVAQRVNYDPYERRNTSRDESPKLPFDILTRTPPEYPRVHGERCILPRFMCHELSRLDDALQDICTEGE